MPYHINSPGSGDQQPLVVFSGFLKEIMDMSTINKQEKEKGKSKEQKQKKTISSKPAMRCNMEQHGYSGIHWLSQQKMLNIHCRVCEKCLKVISYNIQEKKCCRELLETRMKFWNLATNKWQGKEYS